MTDLNLFPEADQTMFAEIAVRIDHMVYPPAVHNLLKFQQQLIADLAWVAANPPEPECRQCGSDLESCSCADEYDCFNLAANHETPAQAFQRALQQRREATQ